MNFSDLFVVMVLATALYGLVVALTGRRHFLEKAVNPYRLTWFIAALTILWVGISLLRLEAKNWDLLHWGELLGQLVTEAPAPARVKVASVAILLSLVFFSLLAWCWLTLPHDPNTFYKPEQRAKAVYYYVTRLKGGLCYALLAWGNGERVEEAADVKQLQRLGPHLPKIHPPGQPLRERTPDEQIQYWRNMAQRLHERQEQLDALIEPANQGRNRRLTFDTEFGGFFFTYLRLPDPRDTQTRGMYLFAATLSQTAMDNRHADNHFHLLLAALQSIDQSIRVR